MDPKSLNVLVVEDEYFVAAELAEILRHQQINVVGPFASIEQAEVAALRERPDCAVLDLNLGGELAFDLVSSLQAEAIPVIILTGYDKDFVPASFSNVPFLQKPFIATELLDTLKRIVR